MHDFLLKDISTNNVEKELTEIGFDSSYIYKAKEKFEYKNIKIFNLNCAQANILKQTALSVGADCATHREIITGKIENSNAILTGNISQLQKIAQKLEYQPFGLKILGKEILNTVRTPKTTTKIMGILNITPDSFSDGGKYYDTECAIKHLHELINDGADIIDIGAESTRPGAKEVSADEQLKHILPVLEYINHNKIKTTISIDTRSAKVASECIKLGANIINDVSGLDFDPKMIDVLHNNPEIKIIIQHSKGLPENMQNNTQYTNLIDEIYIKLKEKIDFALSKGIKKENIIIDPGIGFGKTIEQNFEILSRWQEFKTLGCPILIGVSRKSLLNMPQASNEEKDLYTLAINSPLIIEGIDYIRVHNVKIHKNYINMIQ